MGFKMQKTTSYCFKLWNIRNQISLLSRYYSISNRKRIGIVGSGPAGFYTAQHLLKNDATEVDIFEKLPVPFGLIRYGVAPDHPEIRNVTKAFTKTASHERCNFYGNIDVGKDITISELLNSYHAVVLAFGASYDKELGIPGEDSKNVFPARKLVGWYTGHPDFLNEHIDLDTEVAAIVGHGNVALDVARILLKSVDELKSTDISEYALETLKKSRIKRVILIGRRGPLQVAFTIKEFREMTKLTGCYTEMIDDKIKNLQIPLDDLGRGPKRLMELLQSAYIGKLQSESSTSNQMPRCLELKFCRVPKMIIPDANGRVGKFVLNVNEIEGPYTKEVKFRAGDTEDVIECGLVVRSVGYKSASIDPSISIDEKNWTIPNEGGKVKDRKGLYCSGWVKTGPIGVILSTMYESFATADAVLEDIAKGEMRDSLPATKEDIFSLLKNRGIKPVTFEDWKCIDKIELKRGEEMGKLREKIYNVEEMLKIVESGAEIV